MTIFVLVVVFVILALVARIIIGNKRLAMEVADHIETKALHAITGRARDKAEAEVRRLDGEMTRLLLNLQPLIEKTDWMTGRWAGQFQTLVSLESKRNAAVEAVRHALMDIPSVKHLVASGAPVIPTSIDLNGTDQ